MRAACEIFVELLSVDVEPATHFGDGGVIAAKQSQVMGKFIRHEALLG
jgi:hypothetical protein